MTQPIHAYLKRALLIVDWSFIGLGFLVGVLGQWVNAPVLAWIGGGVFGVGIVCLRSDLNEV